MGVANWRLQGPSQGACKGMVLADAEGGAVYSPRKMGVSRASSRWAGALHGASWPSGGEAASSQRFTPSLPALTLGIRNNYSWRPPPLCPPPRPPSPGLPTTPRPLAGPSAHHPGSLSRPFAWLVPLPGTIASRGNVSSCLAHPNHTPWVTSHLLLRLTLIVTKRPCMRQVIREIWELKL